MTLDPNVLDLARRLVRIPSPSGGEAELARVVVDEMRSLGYDEARVDAAGNATGIVRGREPGLGAVVLVAHLDHVDPGDEGDWPSPPFAAEVTDGCLVGRGAADIKGPLAVQIAAPAALLATGERPRRDVVVVAMADEEVGGAGAVAWAAAVDFPVDLVVVGEPSSNRLALGHRGIAQMWVTFHGRSAHASAPERGSNPNLPLAALVARLPDAAASLPRHPVLGPTTMVPTLIEVDTTSPNVIPARARVLVDIRSATESWDSLVALLHDLAGDAPHDVEGAFEAPPDPAAPLPGFYTPPDHPGVARVRELVGAGTGRVPELTTYRFATDGRHLAGLGAPIVGYSPADEDQAHVAGERISLAAMSESLAGHVALLEAF